MDRWTEKGVGVKGSLPTESPATVGMRQSHVRVFSPLCPLPTRGYKSFGCWGDGDRCLPILPSVSQFVLPAMCSPVYPSTSQGSPVSPSPSQCLPVHPRAPQCDLGTTSPPPNVLWCTPGLSLTPNPEVLGGSPPRCWAPQNPMGLLYDGGLSKCRPQ